eukprot:g15113.t1
MTAAATQALSRNLLKKAAGSSTSTSSVAAGTAPGPAGAQHLIDVHTHMYYPSYMDILRRRTRIPKVISNKLSSSSGSKIKSEERLVILPNEESSQESSVGRPIGAEYFDVNEKLKFMDDHGISHSIKLNDDVAEMCGKHPARLSGFSILPTSSGGDACAAEVVRSAGVTVKNAAAGGAEVPNTFRPLRGVILGTSGVKGLGLDSLEMEPVYAALEKTKMVLFIHPHYGLRGEDLSKYGHSLELALGFPMETSIAIARLICSGVLDRYPELKVHVAHAGGVLPYLQGRLDSCVEYEKHIQLRKRPSEYLRDLYYDAIIYDRKCLNMLIDTVGSDRLMYGTDHPFFPPKNSKDLWKSALKIQEIVPEEAKGEIFGQTAIDLFGLEEERLAGGLLLGSSSSREGLSAGVESGCAGSSGTLGRTGAAGGAGEKQKVRAAAVGA